jgi:carbamoyl-phosphate synthase large subunit
MKNEFTDLRLTGCSKPRLLFTGGGGAGTEALLRLLSPNYEVFFADADLGSKHFSLEDHQWHQIPFAKEPAFCRKIVDLCHQLQIDLLIPSVDEELIPIAKMSESLNFNLLLPPEYFLSRHLDKYTSNRFLVDAGLPAPTTVIANEGRLNFPCIVKPRNGRGSRHVVEARSEIELQAQLTLARASPEDFILQELVIGEEYTVMVAADNKGKLRAIVPVKVKCKRGITIDAETIYDDEVIKACREIHESDPVSGCYNIQLIKEANGSIKPFEINPRISTTACLGLAAGVDFIGIFLGLLDYTGFSQDTLIDFKDRLRLKRSWHNQIN